MLAATLLTKSYILPAANADLGGPYNYSYTYNRAGQPATTSYPAAGSLGAETVTTLRRRRSRRPAHHQPSRNFERYVERDRRSQASPVRASSTLAKARRRCSNSTRMLFDGSPIRSRFSSRTFSNGASYSSIRLGAGSRDAGCRSSAVMEPRIRRKVLRARQHCKTAWTLTDSWTRSSATAPRRCSVWAGLQPQSSSLVRCKVRKCPR